MTPLHITKELAMPMPYFHSIVYAILMVTMIPIVCTHIAVKRELKSELPLTDLYGPSEWKWTLFLMVWILICDALVLVIVDSGYLSPAHLTFFLYGGWAPLWFLNIAKKQYHLYKPGPASTIPTLV
jgi:hypothetical protein